MDRSEGAKPKGRQAGLFQARGAGKPDVASRQSVTGGSTEPPFPQNRYKIVYADPPWAYRSQGTGKKSRGTARRHYPTMTTEEIMDLPVRDLCMEDTICFLWVTFPNYEEGLKVLRAWGFIPKTAAFIWVKKYAKSGKNFFGMGSYTRANAEACLLGVRPGVKAKEAVLDHGISQIVEAPYQGHSRKPPEVRELIVRMLGDVPRIELFARERASGWDAWGNELPEITGRVERSS